MRESNFSKNNIGGGSDRPLITPLPLLQWMEQRVWAWNYLSPDNKVIYSIIDWLDIRVLGCFIWDEQEWLELHFFEYWRKTRGVGYNYSTKLRTEAKKNVKSRFRAWQRSDWGRKVIKHFNAFIKESHRGKAPWDSHPKWFKEHYLPYDPDTYKTAGPIRTLNWLSNKKTRLSDSVNE